MENINTSTPTSTSTALMIDFFGLLRLWRDLHPGFDKKVERHMDVGLMVDQFMLMGDISPNDFRHVMAADMTSASSPDGDPPKEGVSQGVDVFWARFHGDSANLPLPIQKMVTFNAKLSDRMRTNRISLSASSASALDLRWIQHLGRMKYRTIQFDLSAAHFVNEVPLDVIKMVEGQKVQYAEMNESGVDTYLVAHMIRMAMDPTISRGVLIASDSDLAPGLLAWLRLSEKPLHIIARNARVFDYYAKQFRNLSIGELKDDHVKAMTASRPRRQPDRW